MASGGCGYVVEVGNNADIYLMAKNRGDDMLELSAIATAPKLVAGRGDAWSRGEGRGGISQPALSREDTAGLAGDGRPGVYDLDAGATDTLERRAQGGKVRTAKNKLVYTCVQHGPDVLVDSGFGLGSIKDTTLDKGDEAGAPGGKHFDAVRMVGDELLEIPTASGGLGSDDADTTGAGARGGGFDGGYDADEVNVEATAQLSESGNGGSVAGDDDDFGAPVEQEPRGVE